MLFLIMIFAVACSGKTGTPSNLSATQDIYSQDIAEIPSSLPTPTSLNTTPTSTIEVITGFFQLPKDIDEIRDLLPGSNECQFPCFLGIIPGLTDYTTTVKEFSQVITSRTGEGKTLDGKVGYNFKLKYPENDLDISFDISTLDNKIISELILYPSSTLGKIYSVPEVIDFYKYPDNVYVFTYSEPYGDGVQPFDLVLDYSIKGFMLWYRNPDVITTDEKIELCYLLDIAPTIYLWSPNEKRTFLDIAPIGKGESRDAKQLTEIALMDSNNVSELITDPNGFCVQTGKSNWKDITHYP